MNTSGNQSPPQSEQNRATRRRITMTRIENESNRQVTFSKRRAGLFKKANELCILTGADTGVVVFSPGDKPHSFGHPSVNAVADRYLNSQNINVSNALDEAREGMSTTRQMEFDYLAQVEKMTTMEKERDKELLEMKKSLMLPDIHSLNYEQLDQLKGSVVDFQKNFELQIRINSQPHQDFGGPSNAGTDQVTAGDSNDNVATRINNH